MEWSASTEVTFPTRFLIGPINRSPPTQIKVSRKQQFGQSRSSQ